MKALGKYQGIFCFECSEEEYRRIFNKGEDNGRYIHIINGTMVRNNKIIGYYDGDEVKEIDGGWPYFATATEDNHDVMQFKQKEATFTAENSKWDEKFVEEVKANETAVAVPYEELVKQDIDFSKYSTVVDEFFALLEV